MPERCSETASVFKKMLKACQTKLCEGQQQRLQWENGSLYVLRGHGLICMVVTASLEYPDHFCQMLSQELLEAARGTANIEDATENALDEVLRPTIKSLMAKYEEPTRVSKSFRTVTFRERLSSTVS